MMKERRKKWIFGTNLGSDRAPSRLQLQLPRTLNWSFGLFALDEVAMARDSARCAYRFTRIRELEL